MTTLNKEMKIKIIKDDPYRVPGNVRFLSRALFSYFNRFIVVPAFKMGLGRFISNPLTGNIMVLKFRGRKTGKVYFTPVNYAVIDGKIYCYQGKRLKGQWYLSLMANPEVEILLPDGHLLGFAEEVIDSRERQAAMRQILKSSGLGSFIYSFNLITASDRLIQEKTRGIPVVRITPYEIKRISSSHPGFDNPLKVTAVYPQPPKTPKGCLLC